MPVLFKRIALLVFCSLLLMACRKEEKQAGPQIIYAGLGVSNCVEIGMTMAQIGKRNRDMEVSRFYPNARFWEKLFKKPRFSTVGLPSRAAMFSVNNERDPVTQIHFRPDGLRPAILRSGSNEVRFEKGSPVTRKEIINLFGEPNDYVADGTYPEGWWREGTSVCFTNPQSESIMYPRHGVYVFLSNDAVRSFSILKKFGGTNAPARP